MAARALLKLDFVFLENYCIWSYILYLKSCVFSLISSCFSNFLSLFLPSINVFIKLSSFVLLVVWDPTLEPILFIFILSKQVNTELGCQMMNFHIHIFQPLCMFWFTLTNNCLIVVPRQKYCESTHKTVRRKTRTVMVGNVAIGSEHPIRIQTMTTTDTKDVAATVEQVLLFSFNLSFFFYISNCVLLHD